MKATVASAASPSKHRTTGPNRALEPAISAWRRSSASRKDALASRLASPEKSGHSPGQFVSLVARKHSTIQGLETLPRESTAASRDPGFSRGAASGVVRTFLRFPFRGELFRMIAVTVETFRPELIEAMR